MLLVILALNPSQLVQTWLLIVVLLFFITFIYTSTQESIQGVDDSSLQSKKQNITLTALLEDQGDPTRWRSLIEPAMQKLMERHPDLDIEFNYTTSPYNVTRLKILSALEAKAPIDLITIDQIWLGEFAGKGLLSDLSNFTETWGRQSNWYQANWDGGVYQDKVFGIWAWTDVRGIWYWKDLLDESGVEPQSLMTWEGYIDAARKLNSALRPHGIEGVHLTGADHSPDLWPLTFGC
jgi:multiple sugar transport system substrate-binding protein